MPSRPARREYRTWILDSRRWGAYRPRDGDIVIATYPKCGTTWMQQIVGLLIFQTPQPRSIMQISPWVDRRFPLPVEAVMAQLEAQTHCRFLKSHLPLDGLPVHDGVLYIHVVRDGRDVCLSYHNHCTALSTAALAAMDAEGRRDAAVGRPYPRPSADPAAFFRAWISRGVVPGHDDGLPFLSFFETVRSYWEERAQPGRLLVHYSDLKADLAGEVRRVAGFLDITVPADAWPGLVAAASFEAMRRDGDTLMGGVGAMFDGGARSFFHHGDNGRWRDVLTAMDLALYEAKCGAGLPRSCAAWVAGGQLAVADDPRATVD